MAEEVWDTIEWIQDRAAWEMRCCEFRGKQTGRHGGERLRRGCVVLR